MHAARRVYSGQMIVRKIHVRFDSCAIPQIEVDEVRFPYRGVRKTRSCEYRP